jgi:hypothetical protein
MDKEKSLLSVLALHPHPPMDYVLIHDFAIDINKIKQVFYLMSGPKIILILPFLGFINVFNPDSVFLLLQFLSQY